MTEAARRRIIGVVYGDPNHQPSSPFFHRLIDTIEDIVREAVREKGIPQRKEATRPLRREHQPDQDAVCRMISEGCPNGQDVN